MSEKFYTILTNIGKAKIANSGVMGSKVNFVKFKIGDSNGSYYEPTEAQRDLIHTVYEGNITDIEVDKNNPNWIKINLMIPANVGGFTIREYGVFDESGNMLAVAKCAESYKPIAEDGSTKELILRMILAVSNTSSVNMELDPTLVFVSKDELEKVRQELTLHLKDLDKDSYPIVEATGTNAYIGASARIKAVGKGTRCTLFVGTASNGNCSLNLNNSGAVAIKDSNGNVVTNMKANIPYNLCHNGWDFILQGKGGGGNLIPKYLLAGYYGEGDNGRVDGAMVNRGAPTSNLNCEGVVNLQEGYYAGGQIIANSLASQTPANATAAQILAGYSAWVNGIKISGNATIQSLGGSTFVSGTGSVTLTEKQSRILVDFSAKVPSTVRVIWGKFTSGSSFYFVNFRSETSGTFKPIVWDKYYSKYADENPVAITGINLGDGDSSHTWSAGTYTYTWYAI